MISSFLKVYGCFPTSFSLYFSRISTSSTYHVGAGQDVGRSCIIVNIGGKTIMFDCGMHMGYNDSRRFPDFTLLGKTQDYTTLIDLVIISHLYVACISVRCLLFLLVRFDVSTATLLHQCTHPPLSRHFPLPTQTHTHVRRVQPLGSLWRAAALYGDLWLPRADRDEPPHARDLSRAAGGLPEDHGGKTRRGQLLHLRAYSRLHEQRYVDMMSFQYLTNYRWFKYAVCEYTRA